MASGITISVVIPVYNGVRFIAAAVESALNQSLKILECIVIDDGSQDRTAEVAEAFGVPVRVVRQPRQGVASARNRGIALAAGTHVALLDADDVWLPKKLERQLAALESTGAEATICGMFLTDADLGIEGEQRGRIEGGLRGLLSFQYGGLCGSSLLASRALLECVGGFHLKLSTSADWEILARLLLEGPVAVVEEPLFLYRKHEGNMHRNVAAMEHDMRLAFDRIFADHRLDPALKAGERRFRAILHGVLAGSYFRAGRPGAALRNAFRAALWDPRLILPYLRRVPHAWSRKRALR